MFVSNLALAAALAGSQPVCNPGMDCDPDVATQQESPDLPEDGAESSAEPAVLPDDQVQSGETVPQSDVIVVEGELGAPQGDPAEAFNAATYEVVEAVDLAVVEPIATAYDKGIPKPIRSGLRNVLRNLGEPINFLNFLLQFKPGKALKTLGRFTINTTLGIGGIFDPATDDFHIRYERNGLANTLGYYGVGPGPYLYLPFIGSTTLRDLAGQLVDLSIIPTVAGKPFNQLIYSIPVGTLSALETRIRTDDQIDAIRDRCGDAYSASRDIYLIQRQLEIDGLRGKQSDNLAELVERLEFNCDIEILTAGGMAPGNREDFVNRNTNLLGTNEAIQEGQQAASTGDPAAEEQIVADPVPEAEVLPAEPAEPEAPAIRFVSQPVVQPLESD